MIKLPVAALRRCASDAGISEGFLDRYNTELETFALRIAAWQQKKDQQKIRQWYFNDEPNKPRLFELLGSDD